MMALCKWRRLLIVGLWSGLLSIQPTYADMHSRNPNWQETVIEAFVTASTSSPQIGQPLSLTIVVTWPAEVEILQWPEIPDNQQWYPIEIISEGQPAALSDPEHAGRREQTLRVVVWETGDVTTPDMFVTYRYQGQDEVLRVSVRPAFVSVRSVLATQDMSQLDIMPHRGTVDLPTFPLELLVASGIATLVTLGGYITWRRNQPREDPVVKPVMDRATALATIRQVIESEQEAAQQLEAVLRVMRGYIEHTFQIRAASLTNAELTTELENTGLPSTDTLWIALEQVEIARYSGLPVDDETRDQILLQLEDWLKEQRAPLDMDQEVMQTEAL